MSTNLCSLVGGNTGRIDCDGKRRTPVILLVGSKEFTPSDYADEATLYAAIQTAINQSNGTAGKLFPFPEIGEVADATVAASTGNLALGPQRQLTKERPGYTYSVEIGHTQFQKLLVFHNKEVPVITLDSANQGWFYKNSTSGNIRGEIALITVSGNGFENGTDATTGVCTISVAYKSVDDFQKKSAFWPFSATVAPSDFQGLKDVTLTEVTAHTTNVYKVGLRIPTAQVGGTLNPWDDIGAAVAALTFTAGTGTGYATPLTITSVAVDNTLKCLTVTFDSTMYTALAALTKIKLTPPTVATMFTAGLVGYELGSIVVSK